MMNKEMETKPKLLAITGQACPICLHSIIETKIITTVFNEHYNSVLNYLHHRIIGLTTEPCEKCEKLTKYGIVIIEIDKENSPNLDFPVRTGFVIAVEEKFFSDNNMPIPDSYIYMDHKDIKKFGLVKNRDPNHLLKLKDL